MKHKMTALALVLFAVALWLPTVAASKSLPSVIEVIGPVGDSLSSGKILSVCKRYQVPAESVYQWKNHLVIYNKSDRRNLMIVQLKKLYPKAVVKYYAQPFYVFDRKRCKDASVAKAWDHILLTANLVKDTAKQNEYMQYHATQFEKWPEVSNGFCNASFQQLLVFRNGRQLMLVISIPKGESLDKLNPKTTENNPRVDEWNRIMAGYQEGIPGTKPGEVWVFLKPVK